MIHCCEGEWPGDQQRIVWLLDGLNFLYNWLFGHNSNQDRHGEHCPVKGALCRMARTRASPAPVDARRCRSVAVNEAMFADSWHESAGQYWKKGTLVIEPCRRSCHADCEEVIPAASAAVSSTRVFCGVLPEAWVVIRANSLALSCPVCHCLLLSRWAATDAHSSLPMSFFIAPVSPLAVSEGPWSRNNMGW